MSSQSVSSSGSVSSLGGPLQITGLASGLDTNAIISAMIAVDRLPITNFTNEQKGLQATNAALGSIQTALQGVALDAQRLGDVGLWAPAQTITSTNSAVVGAVASSTSGIGAVVGGYQVDVTALATSAQKTYQFTSQNQTNTITIGAQQYDLAAGATVSDLADQINRDASGSVWAAVTSSSNLNGNGTLVLSDRATGTLSNDISPTESSGTPSLSETAHVDGNKAQYAINGVAQAASAVNTITTAIPGVTLTLSAITGANPVTVKVGAPAPSASNLEDAVNTFVKDYNAALDLINGQIAQKPSSSDPTQGTLFGDNELTSLMNQMRIAIYTPDQTIPPGPGSITSLSDLGISTGAATGDAPTSPATLEGKLTVNTATLAAAIANNPTGVQALLQKWSGTFYTLVDGEAGPGGSMDSRVNGDDSEISALSDRIDAMNEMLQTNEQAMVQQFARLEATLSQSQSEGAWLTSQVASMSANNSH